jgi:hypothetical protein
LLLACSLFARLLACLLAASDNCTHLTPKYNSEKSKD